MRPVEDFVATRCVPNPDESVCAVQSELQLHEATETIAIISIPSLKDEVVPLDVGFNSSTMYSEVGQWHTPPIIREPHVPERHLAWNLRKS